MDICNRIKRKASELFCSYGVKSITMDEIASQLGISKKTIYQSFSDKNELVDEVIKNMLAVNKEQSLLSHEASENAVHEVFLSMKNVQDLFLNLNSSFIYDIERGFPLTFKRFSEYKNSYISEIIRTNIERGKNEELYREELNTNVITNFRLATLLLPFREDIFPRNHFQVLSLQQELVEYYLYGMVTPKGYKLITKYKKERENQDK